MTRFQAIDNNNCGIESFFEGKKPSTLEGAAQAWASGFKADYSDFDAESLKDEWMRQEAASIASRYDTSHEDAFEEATLRFQSLVDRGVVGLG